MVKVIHKLIFTVLVVSSVGSAFAGVESAEMPQNVAFSIGDSSFSYRAVSHLIGESKKHNPSLKPNSLVKGLIENRLLVESLDSVASGNDGEYENHEQDKEHDSHDHRGHDNHDEHGGHAEYTHQIGINVQAMSEYDQLLNSISPLDKSANFSAHIQSGVESELAKLNAVLVSADKNAMGSEDLSEKEINQVRNITVLTYKLGGTIKTISYWDVFTHSNVHDRTRLRRADKQTIVKRGMTFLAREYQQHQIAKESDWDINDLLDLKQFVFDKVEKQAHFKNLGIIADLHHDTPSLQRFIDKVSEKDIKSYYVNNKDEFVQVSSVKARHITVATQQQADQVYSEIKKGLSFADAIQKYSIDDDKNATPAGSLGKVDKNTQGLTFRKKLSLIQVPGKVSTPYRMLDGKSYEIILVDEKLPEHLPLTDKSVHRSIVNKLARSKAAQYVENLKSGLVKESKIRLNKSYYSNVRW